jgi:hypothetical protein
MNGRRCTGGGGGRKLAIAVCAAIFMIAAVATIHDTHSSVNSSKIQKNKAALIS